MKKLIAILMVLVLALGTLTACGSKEDKKDDTKVGTNQDEKKDDKKDDKQEDKADDKTAGDAYEIALITDKGNIDDKSFNQGAWEGVVEFAKANNVSHQYYKPEEASDAGYLACIELAIAGGAKVVVTPGFLFEVAMYEAQTRYPDVKFILLDGAPHTADYSVYETKENVASVMYAEEESGYLAGYAAVMDGMKKLGFMGGMAVPAVQAFGYGFLQGAQDAAKELGLGAGEVQVTYHYTGNFEENDTNKATAKTMYQEGTEVIFACGGSVGKSVMAAAAEAGAKVIGVDVDQRYDSETVITSATKGLGASVVQVLESIYKTNSFNNYGGKTTYFDATNDGVGLPTQVIGDPNGNAFDRFNSFTIDQYKAVYAKLVDGSVDPIRSIDVADAGGVATAQELVDGLKLVEVKVEVR
jgi:basic membrane protein A